MYRVAELGQAGVTLLHDLANHLSVLTLEVEGLQAKQQSQEVDRIKKAIHYLESIVDDTRGRLHGEMRVQTFDIVGKVREIVAFLRYKAIKANVVVDWHPNAQEVNCRGDMARFCQLIAYIISNAIDAYDEKSISISTSAHRVVVSMECNDAIAIIRIRDWGKGIPKNVRKNLFKPFRSTKKHGLGLGLFIAKQIIETNFSGSITLNPTFEYTEFIVTIPVEAKV